MPERSGAAGRPEELPLSEGRAEDAGPIARLHIQSWRATYAFELSPAFLAGQDPEAHAAHWRRELDSGVLVLLTRHGGALSGFVACGPTRGGSAGPSEWEIYNLHVAPHRKGQGLGSRLFDAAARRGMDQGAQDLILWVVETNRPARAFYERKGMRCDGGRQEHSVGPGESLIEVRYRMSLTAARGPASPPEELDDTAGRDAGGSDPELRGEEPDLRHAARLGRGRPDEPLAADRRPRVRG